MIPFVSVTFLAISWASINTGLTIQRHGFGQTMRHYGLRFYAWVVGMSMRYEYMACAWAEGKRLQRRWMDSKMATEVEG